MLHREGRLDHHELDPVTPGRSRRPIAPQRNWEGAIFAGALIVILILGAIAGMNALIGLFPH